MRGILKTEFFKASLLMIVGSNVYNIGQFIFHFISGRVLGKVEYGDLAVVISILGIAAILQQGFSISIVKHIAAGKDSKDIKSFISWVFKNTIVVSIELFLFSLLSGYSLQAYLKFNNQYIAYGIGAIAGALILATTTRAILQGLLRFGQYSTSLILEIVSKVAITIGLFALNFKILGALGGLFFGYILASLLNYFFLKEDLKDAIAKKMIGFFSYSFAAFVSGLALTSFYSMDLILVKVFFGGEEAGLYAATSVLGRMVFFGITPFTQTMFPLISKRFENKQNYLNVFLGTSGVILLCVLFFEAIFYFVPNLLVNILYGNQYIAAASMLWKYGLFAGLLGISYHITQFYLSLGRKTVIWVMVVTALLQFVLIVSSHPSLDAVIDNSIISVLVMLAILIFYSFWQRALLKYL